MLVQSSSCSLLHVLFVDMCRERHARDVSTSHEPITYPPHLAMDSLLYSESYQLLLDLSHALHLLTMSCP